MGSKKICGDKVMKYDFLIVGAGLFGSVFAHEAGKCGKSCLVIDKRTHIAGNAYTKVIDDIQIHCYGPHIFHTNDADIWEYVNNFAKFNNFVNAPLARYEEKIYNLPFNMNTFYQLWGAVTPAEAYEIIEKQRNKPGITDPKNLEEQALLLVGHDIYEKLIKGYTEKQWECPCKDLPASIIKRIPLRFTYNNNYFNDRYQGIPIDGYTNMIGNMLQNCKILLNTNYFDFAVRNPGISEKVIYTGQIDEFFDYCFGALEYRSLHFETKTLPIENYQGNAVVNYTCADVPYTRVIEHKHFEFKQQNQTVVTHEYPIAWQRGMEPYYPINNKKNNDLYQKYHALADELKDVHFGGRLGEYAYFDMDKVIASALKLAKQLL